MQKTEDFLDDLEIEDMDAAQEENGGADITVRKKYSRIFLVPLIVLGILLICLLALYAGGTWYKAKLEKDKVEAQGPVSEGDELPVISIEEKDIEKLLQAEYTAGAREGEDSVLKSLKESLEQGNTVVETLRRMYKEDLVLASGGRYHFVPIREELAKNSYTQENLVELENGELQYWKEGVPVSYKGIDVSKFQGNIDWKAVAADGVTFAFIRVGFRGYGANGTLMEDVTAKANLQGANDAGIKTGVYFYTQAITREEVLEEAQLVLDLIAPYRIDCPVVIDVEKVSDAGGRMNKIDPVLRTELVDLFCETIQAAGYRPMIYHNLEMGAMMLDLGQLEQYDKWFAYYNKDLYYPYAYKVWQYSDKGSVNGIKGDVDLNIAFEPVWE